MEQFNSNPNVKMHFGISVKFTNRKQDNMRNFFVVVSLIKDSILNIYIFGRIYYLKA